MDDRLRQRGRGHGARRADCTTDRVAAGRGFRRDPRLRPSRKDQQSALGASVLDRGAHERVDQLLQHDLARHGLRHFDHRREVQMLDRRADRARRPRYWLFLPEVRIELARVAAPSRRLPNADSSTGRPANTHGRSSRNHAPRRSARRVHWRAPHCGQSRLRGPSGWPVRRGCSASSSRPFNACDLGADQRGAVLEILRAILRPYFELPVVGGQSLEMLLSLAGRCGIAGCGAGKRAVKVILRRFETVMADVQSSRCALNEASTADA